METTTHRPAVRVICLDRAEQLLLLHWRDPIDGELLWEPPGGGIEPGESPLQAARRELAEETGLDPAAIGERFVEVERDVRWNGWRYVGVEQFFLARYAEHEPALHPGGLLPDEQRNLQDTRWLPWRELPTGLQPPELLAVLRLLDPSGPWALGEPA